MFTIPDFFRGNKKSLERISDEYNCSEMKIRLIKNKVVMKLSKLLNQILLNIRLLRL